MLQGKSYNL